MSKVDTLVRGTLVNVNTGQLEDRAIAIDGGEIVALEERPAERELEAEYIAPGLIDAHVHVESSMVTVSQYGEALVSRGVTSIIHDPHEIANVLGAEGVRAVYEDAEHTPLKARFSVPSSVPASSLQDGGATLDAAAVADLLDHDTVVALGEVMDLPALVSGEEDLHAKIRAARERGLTVDGHLPRVTGSDLQEASRFLDNDHESITEAEAREKLDVGMRVYLREGSSTKNLSDLVGIVDEVPTRRLSLCTDDRDVVDLIENGGVDFAVRKAIAEGVDPVEAVQMATLNTAESYDLPFGRIEPGAPADMVLLEDLERWEVDHVLVDGELDPTEPDREPPSTELATGTVEFEPVSASDLAVDAPLTTTDQASVRVLEIEQGIQTARAEATLPVTDGRIEPDPAEDVLSMAVIERHGHDAGTGRGFVRGLELERGAIGSTVAHDAHNCVVAGTAYEGMTQVANHLREIGGGIAVYDPEREEPLSSLALPVAGLMSDQPLPVVFDRFKEVIASAEDLGLDRHGLMTLSFLALEVIPQYRLTNRGLVDVEQWDHVDVVLE